MLEKKYPFNGLFVPFYLRATFMIIFEKKENEEDVKIEKN